jgi:hypothetical protein
MGLIFANCSSSRTLLSALRSPSQVCTRVRWWQMSGTRRQNTRARCRCKPPKKGLWPAGKEGHFPGENPVQELRRWSGRSRAFVCEGGRGPAAVRSRSHGPGIQQRTPGAALTSARYTLVTLSP